MNLIRKKISNFLIFLAALLICFGITEITLRIFGYFEQSQMGMDIFLPKNKIYHWKNNSRNKIREFVHNGSLFFFKQAVKELHTTRFGFGVENPLPGFISVPEGVTSQAFCSVRVSSVAGDGKDVAGITLSTRGVDRVHPSLLIRNDSFPAVASEVMPINSGRSFEVLMIGNKTVFADLEVMTTGWVDDRN